MVFKSTLTPFEKLITLVVALLLNTTNGYDTLFIAYELQFMEQKFKNATIASPLVSP